MSDPVAAVTEATAQGETAALFADIRAVYGVSVVNLVWRHLATLPGALPHVWGGLRPLYVNGTIAREADRLRAALPVPTVAPMPGFVMAAAGLDEAAMAGVQQVMAAYDRTNAMALVALSAARMRLAGRSGPAVATGIAVPPPAAPPPSTLDLPGLVDPGSMTPSLRALVTALNRMGSNLNDPVLASMWRNLAHWPAFLALCWGVLAPLHEDGRLVRAVAEGLALAEARAATLPPPPQDVAPLDPALTSQVDAALALFTGDAIARMMVVTAVLRRAMGHAGAG